MTWQYQPRVAVVRGVRTPFAKSGTHYAHLSALDLGKLVVTELIQRSGIDPRTCRKSSSATSSPR
jgi:acetyl-CoA acetyltransferase